MFERHKSFDRSTNRPTSRHKVDYMVSLIQGKGKAHQVHPSNNVLANMDAKRIVVSKKIYQETKKKIWFNARVQQ